MAVGAGFEPAEGVNPQSLSRRSRYGRFGTPPSPGHGPDRRVYERYLALFPSKNVRSRSAHSASSTPVVTSTRWFSRGSCTTL